MVELGRDVQLVEEGHGKLWLGLSNLVLDEGGEHLVEAFSAHEAGVSHNLGQSVHELVVDDESLIELALLSIQEVGDRGSVLG